jgi:hypothetical protein
MTKQMTPLRQRMIEDMTIRNMSPSTQKIYVAAVATFSIFHGRSAARRQCGRSRRARNSPRCRCGAKVRPLSELQRTRNARCGSCRV